MTIYGSLVDIPSSGCFGKTLFILTGITMAVLQIYLVITDREQEERSRYEISLSDLNYVLEFKCNMCSADRQQVLELTPHEFIANDMSIGETSFNHLFIGVREPNYASGYRAASTTLTYRAMSQVQSATNFYDDKDKATFYLWELDSATVNMMIPTKFNEFLMTENWRSKLKIEYNGKIISEGEMAPKTGRLNQPSFSFKITDMSEEKVRERWNAGG